MALNITEILGSVLSRLHDDLRREEELANSVIAIMPFLGRDTDVFFGPTRKASHY